MARLFDDASSEYLEVDSAPVTAAPFTMACWFYPDDDTVNGQVFDVVNSGATASFWSLNYRGGADYVARFNIRQTALTFLDTTNTANLNQWNHMIGIEAANDDHTVVLNGDWDSRGTSTEARSPSGANRTSIARLGDSTPGAYFSGGVGECAIWDIALSRSECELLAAGVSPLNIQRDHLVFYAPLLADEDEDVVGGLSLTAYNTPSTMFHPGIVSLEKYLGADQGAAIPNPRALGLMDTAFQIPWRKPVGALRVDWRKSITAGLEACYVPTAGEAGSLRDLSGNGRDAAATGATSIRPDGPLNGLVADVGGHTDAYYYKATVPQDLAEFTMLAICKIDTISGDAAGQTPISYSVDGIGNNRVSIVADNVPDQWGMWDSVNSWLRGTSAQDQGAACSCAVTYVDGDTRKFYYNGVEEATESSLTTLGTGRDTLFIGMEDTSEAEGWDGTIAAVYFFSRVLLPAEIASIHADPYQFLIPA